MRNPELLSLERKERATWNAIKHRSMWVGEKEAEYLMSGDATELIQSVFMPDNEYHSHAKVYGVIAADTSRSRYLWVYLFYWNHLWRCGDLETAYKLIERIKQYNTLRKSIKKLERTIERQQKLLLQSVNN